MVQWLMAERGVDAEPFPDLRMIVYGAAPLLRGQIIAAHGRRTASRAWISGPSVVVVGASPRRLLAPVDALAHRMGRAIRSRELRHPELKSNANRLSAVS